MLEFKLKTAGDSGILLVFGDEISPEINGRISAFTKIIKAKEIEGVIDMIPTFCSLLVNYNPRIINYDKISQTLLQLADTEVNENETETIIVEIPVFYGSEFGPDMETVMKNANMTKEEVISLHSSQDYLIYMLGFLPGFTYLGGLDDRLHTPRLANPRLKIPAGSVGIGGSQTGIYPLESPGGWQLIGITPVKTYNPMANPPILFEAGQYIRFVPISQDEYIEITQQIALGTYQLTVHKGGE